MSHPAGTEGTVNIHDVELLTIREVRAIMRMGIRRVHSFIKTLPPDAVLRGVKGQRTLVHSWALHRYLQASINCPGCGRPWPEEKARVRDGRFGDLPSV